MMWSAAELQQATSGVMRLPFDATGVSIDTRTLQPGDLFVALVGENSDGHAHVGDALARGAAGVMVHAAADGDMRPLLVVPDTLAALWALGRAGRARFAGRVVAVTGSVGKTTAKEMLRTILSAAGPTHAAEASYNNHWGVPLTLARLPRDAAFCVAEIGTNHPGEIGPLAMLARPHVAVITSVEAAHIGHFGSLDAIAYEKSAILDGLEPDGIAVLPGDSAVLPQLAERAHAVQHFGSAQIVVAAADADGTDVSAQVAGHSVDFRINAPGRHMVVNALAALTAAAALGVDGAAALAGFRPIAGRGLRRTLPSGVTLLDESYNANGASMRAALSVLSELPPRRVAVLGDMLELGDHGPAEHAGLAQDVTASVDLLFTCGPLMLTLYDAVPAGLRGAHAPDSASLAPLVTRAVQPGDTVLVKGSLGSRMARIVHALETARC
jgi:UDP-N-acetylmuramoyl-tripeptide--D-alanyl-D-alanine ligase